MTISKNAISTRITNQFRYLSTYAVGYPQVSLPLNGQAAPKREELSDWGEQIAQQTGKKNSTVDRSAARGDSEVGRAGEQPCQDQGSLQRLNQETNREERAPHQRVLGPNKETQGRAREFRVLPQLRSPSAALREDRCGNSRFGGGWLSTKRREAGWEEEGAGRLHQDYE